MTAKISLDRFVWLMNVKSSNRKSTLITLGWKLFIFHILSFVFELFNESRKSSTASIIKLLTLTESIFTEHKWICLSDVNVNFNDLCSRVFRLESFRFRSEWLTVSNKDVKWNLLDFDIIRKLYRSDIVTMILVRFSIKSGRKTWQQHNSFRKSMGIIAERQTIWGTYVCWQLTRQAHDLFTCLCQFSFKSPHFISLTLLLRRWTVHRRPAWHQWDLTSVRWIPVEEKVNFTSFLSGKF